LSCESTGLYGGPSISFSPETDPGDGLLYAVLVRGEDVESLALTSKRPSTIVPRFEMRRGPESVPWPPSDCPLRFDDEVSAERASPEHLGDVVTRLASRLEVLVPARIGKPPSSKAKPL
jgi:hypothetical protein